MVKKINKIMLAGLVVIVLCSSVFAETNLATDPMRIGVGARPLGMGKAYVGLAEDCDTLFINPAGLGRIDSPKLTSMYANLMNDVGYVVLGGVYPNGDMGSIGVGLISSGSNVNFWDAAGTSTGSGNWSSNLLFLSYGTDLNKIGLTAFENVQLGASLKYFSRGGSGNATVEGASATGMDLDIGLLMKPLPWLNVGLVQQNALQGNITSGYGVADKLPSLTKAGVRIGVLGSEQNALMTADQTLDLAVDADINTSNANIPTAMHIGVEYWPLRVLALRAGVDQNASSGTVVSNYTAGVGFRYGGIQFDYAYHPYYGLTDDATHFFSISYVGEAKAPVVVPFKVTLVSPSDKSVIYDEYVDVQGEVEGTDVVVSANDVNLPVVDGKFTGKVPVDKVGKKLVVVKANDSFGNNYEQEFRILRLASFVDVGEGYWAKSPIEETGTIGLVQGYPDGSFKPSGALTRAEMATLIVRAKGIDVPTVTGKVFPDVSADHWAAPYIKLARTYDWVEGYPSGDFKPNQRITKAESITILSRLDVLTLKNKEEFANANTSYKDVSKKHWALAYVEAAKSAGMLDYVKSETLGAKDYVSRAEFVEMLSKTNFAGVQIKELLSWFTGFKKEGGGGTRGSLGTPSLVSTF
ncbi:MAG: PorV/PorQ family protein [Candidatus Saganbacteria bacterium]|nr:PorV/PorQ family protein [Candidatus Saganbacteria bacterium]